MKYLTDFRKTVETGMDPRPILNTWEERGVIDDTKNSCEAD